MADCEWARVKAFGSDIVSAKCYVKVQVTRQQAYATGLAFGLTPDEVDALTYGFSLYVISLGVRAKAHAAQFKGELILFAALVVLAQIG